MKFFIRNSIVIFGFIVLYLFPQKIHAETIDSYDVGISIQKDATIRVQEKIMYDFGNVERHGIYRTIPLTKSNDSSKSFRMVLDSISVLRDGIPETFSIEGSKTEGKIKIGRAASTINGKHEYDIRYIVKGSLTYFSDHDELYWNAIGTDWSIPILASSVVVDLPEGISEPTRTQCFVGSYGSDTNACSINTQDGKIVFVPNSILSPGNGITVVVGFPKRSVDVVDPIPMQTKLEEIGQTLLWIGIALLSFGWYFALPFWVVYRWFTRGRDPKPPMGVASAWFDVPKTKTMRPLTPGETGTLVDEKADIRDITATIIDLARRGYLSIQEEKKGSFTLKKRTPKQPDSLEPFETKLLTGLFTEKDIVALEQSGSFVTLMTTAKDQLYKAVVNEGYFSESPEKVRTRYIVLGSLGIMTGNLPLLITAFTFGMAMPRKTMLGSQTQAVALSLRNFIVTQSSQYKFQAEKQIFFEKFLPYAIVFGVEKIWADRFKTLGIKSPDWYEGYDSSRTFSSVYLASHLGSSLTNHLSSVATPTRSSSGFSSGFSGGFSGGGGGGGGGGSW